MSTIPDESRLKLRHTDILINNQGKAMGVAIEMQPVIALSDPVPEIRVFENEGCIHTYRLEPQASNPDLTGQFLHASIRIFANSAVMIDGIISPVESKHPSPDETGFEGLRFQPFYLADKNESNIVLRGKGLFERGLHFRGNITPTSIRSICFCDTCNLSFSLQHFHAGFSELQYFYSSDSRETLTIPYGAIDRLPGQLQSPVNEMDMAVIEAGLPKAPHDSGTFRYYNSFRCPHCLAPYIDFERYHEMRPYEYYGNTLINVKPIQWTREPQ